MINRFSIEDLFRVILSERNTVFQLENFKNLHFTIAYNENSPDCNLHVTKEVKSEEKKRRITIAVWNKENIELAAPMLVKRVLANMVRPFSISEDELIPDSYYMIPYRKFGESGELDDVLHDHFKENITKPRKSKIKLVGNLESSLREYSQDERVLSKYENWLEPFTRNPKNEIEGYMVISDTGFYHLLNFYGKWYEYKEDLGIETLLQSVFGIQLARKLNWKLKRSLIQLTKKKFENEIVPRDKGIRISYKPPGTNNGQKANASDSVNLKRNASNKR